jgi:CheY-like chemotaxis protein
MTRAITNPQIMIERAMAERSMIEHSPARQAEPPQNRYSKILAQAQSLAQFQARGRASNEGGQEAVCERILIVDDDLDMARLLCQVLQSWGYEVETAEEGRSAIEAVFAFGPQIILLDIDLPWIDGYEIAKLLRSDNAFNTIKLIALTGHGGHAGKVRALKSGFDRHITKPIDIEGLKKMLAGEFSGKPSAHAALE